MAGTRKRVTLVHNRSAGHGDHCAADVVDLLKAAGYDVAYCRAKDDALDAALQDPAGLIVVAGGDGTVAKVARKLRRDSPPLAILPYGTANNIARSLGLDRPAAELIDGWRTGKMLPFHPVDATGPWGRRRLIEGIGLGAFEDAIAKLPKKTTIRKARHAYAEAVRTSPAQDIELRHDDKGSFTGPVAALEISLVPLMGPGLAVAAGADASAARFEISYVGAGREERDKLAEWIEICDGPPPFVRRSARHATIAGRFRRVRIDGRLWEAPAGDEPQAACPITLDVEPDPLLLLVPG